MSAMTMAAPSGVDRLVHVCERARVAGRRPAFGLQVEVQSGQLDQHVAAGIQRAEAAALPAPEEGPDVGRAGVLPIADAGEQVAHRLDREQVEELAQLAAAAEVQRRAAD